MINCKLIILIFLFFSLSFLLLAQAPDWQWATNAGGVYGDLGNGIALDNYGNSYVTGYFDNTATFGSHVLDGYGDVFVAKMDGSGNWIWVTQAGSSYHNDDSNGIATDTDGNCYITGYFKSVATFGSTTLTSNGEYEIFVAKVDANGNWLWATQAGGISYDSGNGIEIDNDGNIYVTGSFRETATFGSYSLTCFGESDIFVAKVDETGNWLWAIQAGGFSYDSGQGIAIDNNGDIYVTGGFCETATFDSVSLTSCGENDIFVAKIDENGNWQWATNAGGWYTDMSNAIAVSDNNCSYISGNFEESAIFGSQVLTGSGSHDIFVAKIDANGDWIWASEAGGDYIDRGYAIALDNNDNCYLTGEFTNTANFGYHSITCIGAWDMYVAKVDVNGNWLWATSAEGSNDNVTESFGIKTDAENNCVVTGTFEDTSLFGSYSLTSNGGYDIFVAKLGNETSVENEIITMEEHLSNFPNPFNPVTTFSFNSPKSLMNPVLEIFNVKGQLIESYLLNENQTSLQWNAKGKSSGIYLYHIKDENQIYATSKMVLLK